MPLYQQQLIINNFKKIKKHKSFDLTMTLIIY